ncbi:MAG: hypothetical protein RBT06_09230 [Smithellaceae bacterium]|jgi:acyl-CoA synthetase (NDP forming)|nr:hypothetical protein [Smithellaceae bacterium]
MKLKSDNIYTSGIEYFFNPKSIAIVGASKNLTKFGGRPISALLKKNTQVPFIPSMAVIRK